MLGLQFSSVHPIALWLYNAQIFWKHNLTTKEPMLSRTSWNTFYAFIYEIKIILK